MTFEEHIEAFRKTGETQELRMAANLVDRRKVRKEKLELWLTLLDVLDSARDPNFDPEDVPAARITIPPGTRLKPDFPISTPEAIADPAARKKYDDAVAANNAKTQAYRVQNELRQLDAELTLRSDAYIGKAYPKSPESVEEMDAAIAEHIHNKGRAAHLRRLVTPEDDLCPPTPKP